MIAHRYLLFLLFFVSGGCGLIYELTWTRLLVLVMGATTFAVTTVLVAFMSGLALGARVAGRYSESLVRPVRVYGLMEIAVGVYCLLLPALLAMAEPLYHFLYHRAGDNLFLLTMVRFVVSALFLLVPASLMGATLPVLVHHLSRRGGALGESVAALYGINAAGAVTGALATGFVLLPRLGLENTTRVAAALNIAVGLLAVLVLDRAATFWKTAADQRRPTARAASADSAALRRIVASIMALSGFAALVYQVGWTRVLIMGVGSSTYAFSIILSGFILGLALGSVLIKPWVDRFRRPLLTLGIMQAVLALSALAAMHFMGRLPQLIEQQLLSHRESYSELLVSELLTIWALILVPTMCMGAMFPLACRIYAGRGGHGGTVVGRLFSVNTLGTIVGSFCAGFVLIPTGSLGIRGTLIVASVISGVLACVAVVLERGLGTTARAAVVAVVVLLVGGGTRALPAWDRNVLSSGAYLARTDQEGLSTATVRFYEEGIDATVAVVGYPEKYGFEATELRINGKPEASSFLPDNITMMTTAHIPLLLTENPRQVLVIGLGGGMTLASALTHDAVQRVDCAEISRSVIEAHRRHFAKMTDHPLDDPRTRMILADGRNHLLLTDRTYDVIISEPSNPWIAGVSNLFTREFFTLMADRLSEGGKVCVWLQGYSISVDDVKMVVRTLGGVFGEVTIWQGGPADYLLVASRERFRVPLRTITDRLAPGTRVAAQLARVGLNDPALLLGQFILGGPAVGNWVGAAPTINTDDNARLEFSAPLSLYTSELTALRAALANLQGDPFEVFISADPSDDAAEALRRRMNDAFASRHLQILADVYFRQGDVSSGLEALDEAVALVPASAQTYLAVTEVLFSLTQKAAKEGNLTVEEQAADLLVWMPVPKLVPRSFAFTAESLTMLRRHRSNTAGRLAVASSRNGDYAAAQEYFDRAIELAPDRGAALLQALRALLDQDAPQAAQLALLYARQLYDQLPQPPTGVVNAYAQALVAVGRSAEARTVIEAALVRMPADGEDRARLQATLETIEAPTSAPSATESP